MIPLLALLVAGVQPGWTVDPVRPFVGDTVVLTWRLPVTDPGVRVRAGALDRTEGIEPLSPPRTIVRSEGVWVRYEVAPFQPGDLDIVMPPVDLIYRDGRVETLEAGTVGLTIASILPPTDSVSAPRPALDPIARPVRTLAPTIWLVFGTSAVVIVWGVIRRLPKPRPSWGSSHQPVKPPPIDKWLEAGEDRAVAAFATDWLRGRMAELAPEVDRSLDVEGCLRRVESVRPDWPQRELADVLRGWERTGFAPAISADAATLAQQTDELIRTLERIPPPENGEEPS